MAQCVVIADDFTGGNAVGALLEKNRCSVCSMMSARGFKDQATTGFDCVVYSTNSRNLTKEQSYQMVFSAVRLLRDPEVQVYAKRIDPAMRGNTCIETQAMLDALGDEDRLAVVVPAFPELKRTNVGGYILVDGKPLPKSLAGLEELSPAETGRVEDLFNEKFNYRATALHLKDYLQGVESLARRIKALAAAGVRAVVMDCTSQEEIDLIADAVLLSGVKYLSVDPGPFTATLTRKVRRNSYKAEFKSRIFGLIDGSNRLRSIQSAQLQMLCLEENVLLVPVRNSELTDDEQRRAAEVARVTDEIVNKAGGHTVAFAISDDLRRDATGRFEPGYGGENQSRPDSMDQVAAAYGQIAAGVLARCPEYQGLYTTGAELTVAVCREMHAIGLRIIGQVKPQTAYGRLIGGSRNGLDCVTSSSLVTNVEIIVDSVMYLKRKLEL